jgi:hypothetical protein
MMLKHAQKELRMEVEQCEEDAEHLRGQSGIYATCYTTHRMYSAALHCTSIALPRSTARLIDANYELGCRRSARSVRSEAVRMRLTNLGLVAVAKVSLNRQMKRHRQSGETDVRTT